MRGREWFEMSNHRNRGVSTKSSKIVQVGNYKFTGRRLGKGNFAKVDEAVHTFLNMKVSDQ